MLNSCKRLRIIIFPIDFNGFLRFKESMLRGKIDLGGSWRPLGGVLGRLGPISRCLGGVLGHLRAILEHVRGVLRRFESSSRPPGRGGGCWKGYSGGGFGGVLRVL